MPRPKLEDDRRRTREVAVLLTGPESRAVREAARRRSMRISEFVREAALKAAVETIPTTTEAQRQLRPDPGVIALRLEIRRLGSNLNQALKLAHQGGSPDLQAAVEDLRAAVRKACNR